jgi:hypothetical protein
MTFGEAPGIECLKDRSMVGAAKNLTTNVASERDIATVTATYRPRDRAEVDRFLHAHPQIVPLLVEASPHLERIFSSAAELELDVFTDLESTAAELYAIIRTGGDPDTAFSKLEEFDRSWWLNALPRADSLLTFTVDLAGV